jgi:hypothetical protein
MPSELHVFLFKKNKTKVIHLLKNIYTVVVVIAVVYLTNNNNTSASEMKNTEMNSTPDDALVLFLFVK